MSSDPVVALLTRAAADGHTWVPTSIVLAAVGGPVVRAALTAGTVVAVDVGRAAESPRGQGMDHPQADEVAPDGIALADLAEDEELLAEGLAGLAAEGRLRVVTISTARSADPSPDVPADSEVRLDLSRLSVPAASAAIGDIPEDSAVVLVGDPDALPPVGPGAVLRDVLAGAVLLGIPVENATVDEPADQPNRGRPAALAALGAALRAGRLVPPDASDRSTVVVPVDSDEQAAVRAVQVVNTSLPRALELAPADIAVLTPLRRGPAGVTALSTRLAANSPTAADSRAPDSATAGSTTEGAPTIAIVHDAIGRTWPAVVLVLPPTCSGVLSRDLIVTACAAATRQFTVIHGVGPLLARLVAELPHRERRTRLVELLRQHAAQPTQT